MKEKYECRVTIRSRYRHWLGKPFTNSLHLTNTKIESEIIEEVKSQWAYRTGIDPRNIEVSNVRNIKKLKPSPANGIW